MSRSLVKSKSWIKSESFFPIPPTSSLFLFFHIFLLCQFLYRSCKLCRDLIQKILKRLLVCISIKMKLIVSVSLLPGNFFHQQPFPKLHLYQHTNDIAKVIINLWEFSYFVSSSKKMKMLSTSSSCHWSPTIPP